VQQPVEPELPPPPACLAEGDHVVAAEAPPEPPLERLLERLLAGGVGELACQLAPGKLDDEEREGGASYGLALPFVALRTTRSTICSKMPAASVKLVYEAERVILA
jgi:hypothetical protein